MKLGKRRSGPTREALRFKWLVEQCMQLGMSQSEFSRLTGIEVSYINKLRNLETTGRSEIGASIIRQVKDGLKVDPSYFYNDYEGQKDHRLFPLSAIRDEKRVTALEGTAKANELAIAQLNATLAGVQAELVRLRQESAAAAAAGSGPVSRKRKPG